MIEFSCPKCGRPIRVPDAAAGQSGQCKNCGTSQVVPTPKEFDQLVELIEASAVVPTSGNLPALAPDWCEYPVFAPPPPTFPPMVRPVAGEPPQQPTHVVTINVARESGAAHSLGIASMVLGIVALVVIWIPLVGLMVAPLGALGLLLGVVGSFVACRRNGSGIGYSIAGGAISALALLVGFSVNYVLFSAEKEFVNRFNDLQNGKSDREQEEARGRVEKDMRDQHEKARAAARAKYEAFRKIIPPAGATGAAVYDSFPEADRAQLIQDWKNEDVAIKQAIEFHLTKLRKMKEGAAGRTQQAKELAKYRTGLAQNTKNNPPYIKKVD